MYVWIICIFMDVFCKSLRSLDACRLCITLDILRGRIDHPSLALCQFPACTPIPTSWRSPANCAPKFNLIKPPPPSFKYHIECGSLDKNVFVKFLFKLRLGRGVEMEDFISIVKKFNCEMQFNASFSIYFLRCRGRGNRCRLIYLKISNSLISDIIGQLQKWILLIPFLL